MYIDIHTLFTFEVSKSDDQSILAAIVRYFFEIKCTIAIIEPLPTVTTLFLVS
jgi:hypothetical protein